MGGECNECGKKTTIRCSKCKIVYYCGRNCQLANFPTHKLECKVVQPPQVNTSSKNNSNTQIVDQKDYIPIQIPLEKYYKEEITKQKLPKALSGVCYKPTKDNLFSNLLIILHGCGDTLEKYVQFGEQLKIPQCSILALQAPQRLPLEEESYSWFTMFDEEGNIINPTEKGQLKRIKSLLKTRKLLTEVIHTLMEVYGYSASNLFLCGFSQGAVVCVDFILNCREVTRSQPLGGCVAISDSLLDECYLYPEMYCHHSLSHSCGFDDDDEENEEIQKHFMIDSKKFSEPLTKLLITHGENDRRIPIAVARKKFAFLRSIYNSKLEADRIIFKTYQKGHQMICSEIEAMEFFKFLSGEMILQTPSLNTMFSENKDNTLHPMQ